MGKILLIDAYSQIYRVFYAIRALNNAAGEPTNAIYGMARLFLSLDEALPTEYGAIAFDRGKCTRRTALLPTYKAQRPPMPDALRGQLPSIREWCEAFGWTIVEQEGFEADDLICGMTQARGDNDVLILSSDKDLAQLVNPSVKILQRGSSPKQPWVIEDAAAVTAKFGVKPEQLCDYLALLGDSSDNIPGIPGCGPKTAAKLLNDYGSIDGIRAHLPELTNKKMQAVLTAESEHLTANRELVRLDAALPEKWSGIECIRRRKPDWERLTALASAQNFGSIAEVIRKRNSRQLELF